MKKILGFVAVASLISFAAPAFAEDAPAAGDAPAAKTTKKSKKKSKKADDAAAGDTAAPAGDKK
ncbi:MAG TPA: hypothetical protein VHB97_09950 [Polyangia bacterium]|jgi:hypothetical protein|nr:hypothetical protein [Polyangia bacterium]